MLIIAHRLSTVVNTDCIYVLKDGVICESGTHQQLMKHGGIYQQMFEDYTRSINWKVGA